MTVGERVVVMRFGHDHDPVCMQMDEVLCGIAEDVKNFATIYVVDINQVPDFNTMYELYDPCTVKFFYCNKHIMIDLGTGNKINWAFNNKGQRTGLAPSPGWLEPHTSANSLMCPPRATTTQKDRSFATTTPAPPNNTVVKSPYHRVYIHIHTQER
ncbi:Aste57867_8167 [Aphanomyces stellatus]|uniref:Aste57867_8167 protein n=1 Tax=Aphanomyces stellatus TaxID=120398 RepID=A0A485KJK5_9STRA|nr:hypothetical protein As57867_008137 [Aphanomyces stellatus]VFT85055.1 Aste57867_8167 [Aphanomyces stellatus]